MKKSRLSLLAVVAVSSLFLTGCGQSSATNHSTQASSSSKSKVANSTSGATEKQSNALWNQSKDQQLLSFMNQWAPTMGQSYTKYDGKHDLATKAGMHYPSDLSKTTVNGSNSSIGWSSNGKGQYDYNVVALYNYDRPGNAATHITYAFAFHNDQPVALVEQSTNGTPDWTQTKNTDVESNFEKIATGKEAIKSNKNSSASNQHDSSSPKISNAQDAVAYLKQQRGNGNYIIQHGTFRMSDNPYATITDTDSGTTYYVYANGTIKEQE
ncbi:DUF4767 domain-containing protein [Limosilactobacillus caecicola]|uniref:DUF4767 domain-containing protein n=1 Tax=Limosilactobacillus caecicola TaxID=2941332 RepID=UPI00283AA331|nr:DUF4767 domain-containing protein [Limosilactobacillus caecicola]